MNLEECFRKRLLRKDGPDQGRAERSLEVSKFKLEQAERAYKHDLFDASLVLAYIAMFHSARGLLFRDGIVEKSHVCLVQYLRAEYARKGRISEGLVNSLDQMRTDRHEAIYGLETSVGSEQAGRALEQSREFIEAARKLVLQNKKEQKSHAI